MSYPPGITLRPVTIGGATILESGEQLSLVAEIKSSRSLMWGATGWQFHAVPRTIQGNDGEELSFSLPVTDLTGWRLLDNPGSAIDVSTPGSYTHMYTIKLTTLQNRRPVAVRTVGPFVLPAEDLSPVDLDLMLPVGTQAGGVAQVPDTWDARVAAAEAAAAGDPAVLYVRSGGSDSNTGLSPTKALATIPAALAKLTAGANVGVIDLGTNQTHTLTAGITLDATRHELRGGPRCVLDFSAMTTGTAITVTGNPAGIGTRTTRAVLTDLELVGPGIASTVDAIKFADPVPGHGVYHLGPTRVHVSHFRRAYCYGENCWAITLWNCTAHSVATCVYFPMNATPAGERITFESCTFHDSTQAVYGQHGGLAFFFNNCSMTYCENFITLASGAKAFLNDCHLETRDTDSTVLFDVSHSAGYLRVNGGIFMIEGSVPIESRTRPSHVTVDDGWVLFSDVFFQGVGLASSTFATGDGVCDVRNARASKGSGNPERLVVRQASRSALTDGALEQPTVWDAWAIYSDTAAITNRLTGANIALSMSTDIARSGTRSLKAQVASLASTTRFGLYVPVQAGRPMTFTLHVAVPGTQTGTIGLSAVWVNQYQMSTYGVPLTNIIAGEVTGSIVKSTSDAVPWTAFDSGARLRFPPDSATHLLIRIDVSAMNAGPIYVDDAAVYYW